jgi:hypothetical protein
MSERRSRDPREQPVTARIRDALGRLFLPVEQAPIQNPFRVEEYPINVDGFYTAYTKARNRLIGETGQRDIDLIHNIGSAATLSVYALTEAVYDRSRHGLYYASGFTYPEVRAQRQGNPGEFIDASDVTLNPETRDAALEFTQAWIVHANRLQSEQYTDRAMWDSFQHMGCSLTVDCLPAGISFEDLGVQQTSEIENMRPATVFTCLETDPDMFPGASIIEDVTHAFQQRVASW